MSKGLKALNTLYLTMPFVFEESKTKMRCLETIEKELKALDIVKQKVVDFNLFSKSKTVEEYNDWLWVIIDHKIYPLTQEEYGILREVLL